MAFVRWRGRCAQLLATVYDHGTSHQVLLASLGGAYTVNPSLQEDIAQRWPALTIHWAVINETLALGPPGTPTPTSAQRTWLDIAHLLRQWADTEAHGPQERRDLFAVAALLTTWHAQKQQDQETGTWPYDT